MKLDLYIFLSMLIFCSCTVSKSVQDKRDKSIVVFLEKNKEQLRDAAAFAIGFTLDEKSKEFNVRDVRDGKIRRLLSNFGSNITVYYNMHGDIYDSTVTFEVTNLFGVKEVIYCFALKPVERDQYNDSNKAMIKISDNIYYTRRPFPLM